MLCFDMSPLAHLTVAGRYTACGKIVSSARGAPLFCSQLAARSAGFEICPGCLDSNAHPVLSVRQRPLVLIVEDDRSIRESLRQSLELEGYATLTASHGREGLDQ